ncbi:MAG: hypothetical protein JSU61_11585, partial [Fidelibacterota bacterium]
ISDWPGMLNIAPGLRIEWDRYPHTYELVLGYSTSKEHFIYFPPFGREVPVYSKFGYVGIKGSSPVKNRWKANYRVMHSFVRFDKFPNIKDIDFDWASIDWTGSLELASEVARVKRRFGLKFERYTLETGYALDHTWLNFIQGYSTLTFNLPQDVQHSLGGVITTLKDKVAFKGLMSSCWRINAAQHVGTTVSYAQRLAPQDNNVWYWINHGYDLLPDNGIEFKAFDDHPDRSQQLTSDAYWQMAVHNNLVITLSAAYRHFADLPVVQYHFRLEPKDGSLSSSTSLTGGDWGEVIGADILIEYQPRGQVRHRLAYGYNSACNGTRSFRDTRRAVPEHNASYQVTYSPVQNFSIWAMLRYTSASVWVDYTAVDGLVPFPQYSTGGTYISSLAGSTVLDLQFQKWFLKRRILANLLFRNLSNEQVRLHPVGAEFDLSFFVQVYFFFDSETLR